MMPKTLHGMSMLECISAMQKCIRRGMEREAMEFAVEVMHSSKAYFTVICNRLEIISHEDIDCHSAPHVVPFVRAAISQAREWYTPEPKKWGRLRMAIGNAIRMMARAPKSRIGDHFQAAIGIPNLIEQKIPVVPDWALDKHTGAGRAQGRGLKHFLDEGTVLYPKSDLPDDYVKDAGRAWEIQQKARDAERAERRRTFVMPDDDESDDPDDTGGCQGRLI
jgi:replication-associated recombination protein RarA